MVLLTVALLAVFALPGLARAGDVNLDQCGNGTAAVPDTCPPWQNGDLNVNNSHYRELDSVPFRVSIAGLAAGTHQFVFEYDTLKSGRHAYDYLTSYNRTVTDADPCSHSPVAYCSGAPTSALIPLDPLVTTLGSGWGGTPLPDSQRQLAGWNVTNLSIVLGGAPPLADMQFMTINFTTSGPDTTAVFAWGGHVASQINWGAGTAAGNISGSPYHMSVDSLDGAPSGSQDKSMKAAAIAPAVPTFETDVHGADSTGTVSVDTPVYDVASLTGVSANGPPTGSVEFAVCGPGTSNPDCATSAGQPSTTVGSAVVVTNLNDGLAQSPTFTPTQAGHYCFRAIYTPDADAIYSPTEHTNTTTETSDSSIHGECFTVAPAEGTLIVEKSVVNDNGGTKGATDFKFQVNGGTATSFVQDGSDPLKGKNTLTVPAGTYSVTEDATSSAGYTAGFSGCSNVVVANGETKTCTITNDDQAGTLIVEKSVVNDNGGQKLATDFKFQVNGGTATSFVQDGSDSSKGKNTLTVSPGTYNVTEDATSSAGYAAGYAGCSDIAVGAGETKTCTITNDDQAGTLIVEKAVVNDNGGTNTAGDFSFAVNGGDPIGFAQNGQDPLEASNSLSVDAGTYSVVEDGAPFVEYDTSYNNCSDITVANGATETCIITNDDVAPTLTLVKTVTNDNGGSALASAWTLTAAGETDGFSGTGTQNEGANQATNGPNDVMGGVTYTLSESGGPSGYAAGSWSCTGAEIGGEGHNEVALAVGDAATCTIDNNDIAASPPPSSPPPLTPPVVPTPPAPKIDLQITKADSPDPDVLGTRVRYLIVVKNNGPDTAHNVQMSDPLPFHVAFSSVSTTQGTCTGGQVVSCQLGTIASGASVTITLFVKTTTTGLVINTATTVGTEAETNPANNTASTSTLVNGPFKPPVVQTGCYAVAVSPHSLLAGKRSTLVLSVHMLGKPAKNARVRVTGAGISKTSGPTNARGVVRMSVKPAKPGILRFQPVAHKGCALPRIGVIGAFTPPVTG
ncbi:MAG: hypothetical protein ACJ757_13670 [Gaiellaceae bacterium]